MVGVLAVSFGWAALRLNHLPTDGLAADATAANLPNAHTRVVRSGDADGVYLNDALKTVVLKPKTDAGLKRGNGGRVDHRTNSLSRE